ncbi:MAG: hypothetical protein WCO71_06715, partial [Pseudomonadota bacterium]
QTAAEIEAYVENSEPEEFCFNKVVDPTVGLASGDAISADMQLAPNLEVAFLNTRKNFYDAQASCASLGAGWHAPASNGQYAAPQAADNTSSLEAVGMYFMGATSTNFWFWSSSTVSGSTGYAWDVYLADGFTGNNGKNRSNNVVCVRP